MGWFGRFKGDFYFEEVVGEGVIWPAYTDDDGVVFLDVDEDTSRSSSTAWSWATRSTTRTSTRTAASDWTNEAVGSKAECSPADRDSRFGQEWRGTVKSGRVGAQRARGVHVVTSGP